MRKLALVLLASCSALFLFGCGKDLSSTGHESDSEQNQQENAQNSRGTGTQTSENTDTQSPAANAEKLKQQKSKEVTDKATVFLKSLVENARFSVDTSSWFESWENAKKAEIDKKLTHMKDELDKQLKDKINHVNENLKKYCENEDLSQLNNSMDAGVKLYQEYNQKQQVVPDNMLKSTWKLINPKIQNECHEPFMNFFNFAIKVIEEANKS